MTKDKMDTVYVELLAMICTKIIGGILNREHLEV